MACCIGGGLRSPNASSSTWNNGWPDLMGSGGPSCTCYSTWAYDIWIV